MALMPVLTCSVYDVGTTGLKENYIGSFTLDLCTHAISTKLFFIKRLVRLYKYLKERNTHPEVIRPIKTILMKMKEYLTGTELTMVTNGTGVNQDDVDRRRKELQTRIKNISESEIIALKDADNL